MYVELPGARSTDVDPDVTTAFGSATPVPPSPHAAGTTSDVARSTRAAEVRSDRRTYMNDIAIADPEIL
jgi:hypothetical protein